jgi:hypothetical protein
MSERGFRTPGALAPHGVVRSDLAPQSPGPANLADILERVLDKGIVIAGDIQINLLDIELLTIKIRLLIASVDRAKEMGINWWESDPTLTRGAEELVRENEQLRSRLDRLERALAPASGSEQTLAPEHREVVSESLREKVADGERETVTEVKRKSAKESAGG